MFCSKCGVQNANHLTNCMNCGAPLAAAFNPMPMQRPNNYLAWSIISTILCCLPTGIAAIVYSTRVDTKFNIGDYVGAQQASDSARKWNIGSLIGGGVYALMVIGFMIIGIIAESQ